MPTNGAELLEVYITGMCVDGAHWRMGSQGRKNSSDLSRSSLHGSTRTEIANPKSICDLGMAYL